MILPKEIKTRHKIRDAKIIRLYRDNLTMEEIGQRFNMTKQNVSVILHKNVHLLDLDKRMQKAKRLNRLGRIFDNLPDEISKRKDILDVISEMRKEIEGEKPTNVNFSETNSITNVLVKLDGLGREELRAFIEMRRDKTLSALSN